VTIPNNFGERKIVFVLNMFFYFFGNIAPVLWRELPLFINPIKDLIGREFRKTIRAQFISELL
jgi:hypothetical protein